MNSIRLSFFYSSEQVLGISTNGVNIWPIQVVQPTPQSDSSALGERSDSSALGKRSVSVVNDFRRVVDVCRRAISPLNISLHGIPSDINSACTALSYIASGDRAWLAYVCLKSGLGDPEHLEKYSDNYRTWAFHAFSSHLTYAIKSAVLWLCTVDEQQQKDNDLWIESFYIRSAELEWMRLNAPCWGISIEDVYHLVHQKNLVS